MSTAQYFDDRAVAIDLRERRDWSHSRRWVMNTIQPPKLPKFTDLGYKHIQIPAKSLKTMKDRWETAKKNGKVRQETWHEDGTQINYAAVKTYMAHLTHNHTQMIAAEVQPIVEKWCGNTDLEMT